MIFMLLFMHESRSSTSHQPTNGSVWYKLNFFEISFLVEFYASTNFLLKGDYNYF